jgi:hypothetical protein
VTAVATFAKLRPGSRPALLALLVAAGLGLSGCAVVDAILGVFGGSSGSGGSAAAAGGAAAQAAATPTAAPAAQATPLPTSTVRGPVEPSGGGVGDAN